MSGAMVRWPRFQQASFSENVPDVLIFFPCAIVKPASMQCGFSFLENQAIIVDNIPIGNPLPRKEK